MLSGWGKTIRTGIMMSDELPAASELDLVITNVIVMDPVLGIFKANIGVKDGVIVGIGHAGNPDVSDNVDLLLGANTVPIPGQGFIATPGGIDTHVHLVQPKLIPVALAAGMTTLITGGLARTRPSTCARLSRRSSTCRSTWASSGGRPATPSTRWRRQIEEGACGLKIHEDYAGYPSIIDQALNVAQAYDIAIAMHTDGMNEASSSTRRSPPSPGAPSTPTTSKASAAGTPRTSWRSPASRTSSARPPPPPSRTASTPPPSTGR